MIENIHSFFSSLSILQGKLGIGIRAKRKEKIDDNHGTSVQSGVSISVEQEVYFPPI